MRAESGQALNLHRKSGFGRAIRYWWKRPAGGKAVFAIALPLVVSTASWTVMHFCDRIFLMRFSKQAFGAAMPAGMVYFTLFCFPMALAGYVTTFVAQYFGAGERSRIGAATWQGVWIGLISGPIFVATIPLANYIFAHSDHGAEIQRLESLYYQTMTLGAGGGIVSVALSSFFTGIGRTRVVMSVNAFAAAINIVLDLIFIFGWLMIPSMGIVGAAIATAIAQWLKVACYVFVIRSTELGKTYNFAGGWRPDWNLIKRIWSYGGQSGLQVFIETAAFTVYIIVMGRLGEDELAATTLAFSVNMLAFLPILGIGMAVSTLVGQQLGRNRPDLAARATWTALLIGGVYAGVMAVMFVAIPDVLIMAHLKTEHLGEFDRLRELSIVLLRFVAFYTMLDMTHIVFVSAIKGAGDTKYVLIATSIVSATAAILGICGERYWGWTLYHFWTVLTIWICLLGVVYWARFQTGKWREMRVIEKEYLQKP